MRELEMGDGVVRLGAELLLEPSASTGRCPLLSPPIIDIYSCYVPGWLLAHREDARFAEQLLAESCFSQNIDRGQLTLHADRGSSMTSKPAALLLADLEATKSFSRPRVSNDNPYSESSSAP
jgi:transposase InsO family protein